MNIKNDFLSSLTKAENDGGLLEKTHEEIMDKWGDDIDQIIIYSQVLRDKLKEHYESENEELTLFYLSVLEEVNGRYEELSNNH